MHRYAPVNAKDPLDVEIAALVNTTAHGLLVERVDPPLRSAPKEGEELKAQYAFSNQIARKVVSCRLTTTTRTNGRGQGATTTKKVMCRVGGGGRRLFQSSLGLIFNYGGLILFRLARFAIVHAQQASRHVERS